MNNNLAFHKTIVGSLESKTNQDIWKVVLADYDAKKYKESIQNTINYINPILEKKYANSTKTVYKIPHGSTYVEINITDKEFKVNCPFLSIEGAKVVPLLRQIAQLNFTPLTITKINLVDTILQFNYSCALELCEPYKIYDVLREICINADHYDDEFIAKFDAKYPNTPTTYPYSKEIKTATYNAVQKYIKDAFIAYEQLENKRLNQFLWDILSITLLKIDYYCSPQGNLRNEIEKTIAFLNSKEEYNTRLSSGKELLKKIQNYDQQKFEDALYKIDIFIPFKYRSDLESVRNNLKNGYETAEKEIKSGDFLGATFSLEYAILNLFYNYNVEDSICNVLTNAMEKASEKANEDAAKILFENVQLIMTKDDFTIIKSTEKKGFFSKLFG